MQTPGWIDLITDAWEEAYIHSNTVEQLLYEFNQAADAAPETIAKINSATLQYQNAMDRYRKASSEFSNLLAEQLN
jgi:hypothetical protein